MTVHDQNEYQDRKALVDKLMEKGELFLKSKAVCGVYLLYHGSLVVYVGKSSDVHRRILQHTDKEFDSYRVIRCDESILDDLEACLIEWFDPEYNADQASKKAKQLRWESYNRFFSIIHPIVNPPDPNAPEITLENPFRKEGQND